MVHFGVAPARTMPWNWLCFTCFALNHAKRRREAESDRSTTASAPSTAVQRTLGPSVWCLRLSSRSTRSLSAATSEIMPSNTPCTERRPAAGPNAE
eukprot:CAMPEP_0183439606 /NCGR_PEP_ID=MMETSP0370-20130417/78669_1 /TAXON_ID=268820 /ORGANISM="Peridinium aciculiferum, Strain PAER-2" /LENGTH=95 /DNA_ID=CAMNT_0025628151 /DNA_START=145 /DNA_END=429 /DNA_ORIENTATION=+